MLTNPAKQLYINMDIENLEQPVDDKPTGGLLSPRKPMSMPKDNVASQPAVRVGRHMLILRKQREKLNG
jgi:hypothetical protein